MLSCDHEEQIAGDSLAHPLRNRCMDNRNEIMTRLLALLSVLMLSCLAARAEYPPLPDAPPPPPPPPPMPVPAPDATPPPPSGLGGEEELQPEVKITKRGEDIIYEYRINNQLYMVKVVPRIGFPYYLVDQDGNGSLESHYNTLGPDIIVPRWVLFRW
jgi:hypothetical protein